MIKFILVSDSDSGLRICVADKSTYEPIMQIYLLHHKMTKRICLLKVVRSFMLYQSLQESLFALHSQMQFTTRARN